MTSDTTSIDFIEQKLDRTIINTIKTLSIDAVQQANSGHPGLPLGAADFAYVLWTRFLKHNPEVPEWPDRDRFVLSAGHGCMLLYSLLHLCGYDLSIDEIKNFRQWGSKTPGHPEAGHTPGVEATTGPLGQGFANGVGMALSERLLAKRFNTTDRRLVDHFTYVLASDGDLMEGVASEAASIAGHLRLGKLVCFYDDNKITIEGSTEIAFTEDVGKRFEAYGWHIQRLDGHDLNEITIAIEGARAETARPSLIIGRTHIAHGSPNKQDTASAHGSPLGPEEVRLTKINIGWEHDEPFHVPAEVREFFAQHRDGWRATYAEWTRRLSGFRATEPQAAALFQRALEGVLEEECFDDIPQFDVGAQLATRAASGQALQAIAARQPTIVGGSADLAPSNNTYLDGSGDITSDDFSGRNLRFGVREHAMGSIMNGMSLHGGFHPYGGTFLTFSDYMRPAIRLAALSHLPVTYVFTHDSIFLGEDGPTHQPIEHLASLRAMPNLVVLRPADAVETAEAWRIALERQTGPTALVLTRQKLPVLDRRQARGDTSHGAYILHEAGGATAGKCRVILLGTGSEVHLLIEAADTLGGEGVATRVVSMPSWELFEAQTPAYRESVLPAAVTARVAVEAGQTFGWDRYSGSAGTILGIERFGASAPLAVLAEEFGFTAANVARLARDLLV